MWTSILIYYWYGTLICSPLMVLAAVVNLELDGPVSRKAKIKESVKCVLSWPVGVPLLAFIAVLELYDMFRSK